MQNIQLWTRNGTTYMYFRKSLNPYYERTLFDIPFALV